MFMKWAKGKAMESCWGEDNMKLLTLNMKKAVSKCMQEDAPELDLPPFRYMNRFTNSLVSMANSRSQDQDLYKMMKFMMMMKMMHQVGSNNQNHHSFRTTADETGKYRNNFDHQMMDRMDNGNMMENMMKMMSRMMNRLDVDDSSYLVCSETDCVMGSVGSMMSCMMTLSCMISMSAVMMVMVSPGSVRPGCDCGDEQRYDQTPHSLVPECEV